MQPRIIFPESGCHVPRGSNEGEEEKIGNVNQILAVNGLLGALYYTAILVRTNWQHFRFIAVKYIALRDSHFVKRPETIASWGTFN